MVLEEEWRCVPGYEGRYQVSSHGRLVSFLSGSPRLLREATDPDGYKTINLYLHGNRRTWRVHILVLTVFVSDRPHGMQGCHNDGDQSNNKLSNLRWDTATANANDKRVHGTSIHGSKNHKAKLSAEDVLNIRKRLSFGETQVSLAAIFGVAQASISAIKLRKVWDHL